ncbi:DotI/IcmL family type IV secretion protein, partial [Xenorhabdus bovienii]|nr:DotI/IcmL family type IV secretion protein [Xenorhabdus bovienii]
MKEKEQATTPAAASDPYASAIAQHNANQLNVGFTRKLLTANVWFGASTFITMIIIGCLVYAVLHPPVKYFATQDGRVIPLHPTDT